jgi:CheY-like chemotaxis protein
MPKNFILIDDDPLNNSISKMVLKRVNEEVTVKDFEDPELALVYLEKEFGLGLKEEKATLFLDINMPSISGWEFLDIFNTYSESIKNQINIYILSSSIDPMDIERAKLHPLVIGFLEKPLKTKSVSSIFE